MAKGMVFVGNRHIYLILMQTNILWRGREYYSLENCLVSEMLDQNLVRSTIIGFYEGKIYQVSYIIKTTKTWQTVSLEISCMHDNNVQTFLLHHDGKGNWTLNGSEALGFTGCIDVDIPLTPFTNTLPIRRLRLSKGQSREIKVVYCDVLAGQIYAVRQRYTYITTNSYHYENVPNDFEATIVVDDLGFVVDYPALFVRKAIAHPSPR